MPKNTEKMSKHLFVNLLISFLLLIIVSTPAMSGKLYKWVDDDGNIFYSDKIPPKAQKGEHSRLNQKGVTVERKGAAKTAEQVRKERELEELRRQKEAVIAEQQAKDRVLLRTFRSEDDMILARDGKIRSVNNYINITRGNIKRFKAKLAIMQSQAADIEKGGGQVSKKFLDEMDGIKRQINQSYSSIVAREQNKEDIRKSADEDIRRFRVLKKLNIEDNLDEEARQRAELNTVYICPDVNYCNMAWIKAQDYVKKHATTKLQLVGEGIYMTRAPKADNEISLTVARIKNKKTQQEKIFLDQQCRSSVKGAEFCNSEQSKDLKRNFIPFLLK